MTTERCLEPRRQWAAEAKGERAAQGITNADVMDELENGERLDYFDEDATFAAGTELMVGSFDKARTMFSEIRERAKEKAWAKLYERRLRQGER